MTNWTFDDTIPATNDNPSDDQPGMLDNNISTLGIIAINHVGFNFNNGGQHTAIQFNIDADYTPSGTVSPPALFITFGVPVPQLRFYSGTPGESANQYTSATNWSTFLFNGMIMKGGTITTTGLVTVYTFSALTLNDYPNNNYSIVLTPLVVINGLSFAVTAISTSGFTVTTNAVTPYSLYFMAIGN